MPGLNTLLAHCLVDINRDFDNLGGVKRATWLPGKNESTDDQPSLVLWANLLRVIPDEGISFNELPTATRVSRRALKTRARLVRRGLLEISPLKPSGQLWKLTNAGRALRDRSGELILKTEEAWGVKVGPKRSSRLRSALEGFVSRLDLELPHYPMTYGAVDGSAIGGPWVPAKPGPPRIPPHGMDWVPVVRAPGDTVTGLGLHALLSQGLMAFTIAYEELNGNMLTAALLTKSMPDGSSPLVQLPPILGVDGSGGTGLERHGIVSVEGSGEQAIAHLTARGTAIRDGHVRSLTKVEEGWRHQYGRTVVENLSKCLEEVDAELPGDLPDYITIGHWRDVTLDLDYKPKIEPPPAVARNLG